MKTILVILIIASLAACTPSTQLHPATATQVIEPTPTTVVDAKEEADIRELVENFGKRLQLVSLLAPNAAEDLQNQYAEFVSPALLETWMNDVSKAPGRMVSSPWPDRIEISALQRETPNSYVIDGFVIQITSTEIAGGDITNRISVHMIVKREQGRWRITEYKEKL